MRATSRRRGYDRRLSAADASIVQRPESLQTNPLYKKATTIPTQFRYSHCVARRATSLALGYPHMAKLKTLSEAETARRLAVTGLRNFGRADDADRYEDMSPREYADEKGFEIVENPRRISMARQSASGLRDQIADLKDRVRELEDQNETLTEKLDNISDVLETDESEDEDDDSDGEVDDDEDDTDED